MPAPNIIPMKHFKRAAVIALLIANAACNHQTTSREASNASGSDTVVMPQAGNGAQARVADSIPVPAGMTQLAQATGDLDKDGQPERVIVYDTKKQSDMGTERQVHIFKSAGSAWTLWHRSTGPVLPSDHGGMMGDPFQDLKIQNGCIVIDHFGGSRDKWAYTHRYRFQSGDWYLIGATVRFGAPCETWKDYDYNLSTGTVNATSETEVCDDEGNNQRTDKTAPYSFNKKPATLPRMDGFYPGDNEVKIPGKEDSFYY